MFFKALSCAVSAVIGVSVAFGGDEKGKKDAAPPVYEPRKIALAASRSVKSRKVRQGVIPPEYGIHSRNDDFSKDDRLNIVVIKVKVSNKTGKMLDGFRLVCEFYGRNAGLRKKVVGPIGAEEMDVKFDAKGSFQCEFTKYTLYDKNGDEYELARASNQGDRVPTDELPPHGVVFFGYKVTLFDSENRVVKEVSWPSNLNKLDMDKRLLEWDVPKPRVGNVGGGTLADFVSPSKNPPKGDKGKSDKKNEGGANNKKDWRNAL